MENDFCISPDDPPSKKMILKSALRLFSRDGIRETTVRAIGAEAGYTNPVLFKYFESKDVLAAHLFERCYLALANNLHAAVSENRTFRDRIRDLCARTFLFVDGHPDAFFYVQDHLREFWPAVSPSLRSKSIIRLIHQILKEGVKEGAVAPRGDLGLMGAAITGFLLQFARMRNLGEFGGKPEAWIDRIEELLLKMVRR